MRRSPALSKLIALARIARHKVEVLSFIEGGPPSLQGYCGIAARYLELLANKENIYPEFVVGHFRSYNRILDTYGWRSGHSWIEFDGNIIDITATQFKNVVSKIDRNFGIKVYVCRNTNPHYHKEKSKIDAIESVSKWYSEPIEEICNKIDEVSL